MTPRLALAKQNLADIVRRQWPERNALLEKVRHIFFDPEYTSQSSFADIFFHSHRLDVNNPFNWFFLPKNTPEIIGKGTHTVVLDIGNGFVAKFRPSERIICFGKAEVEGQYILHVENAMDEKLFLFETIRSLRELGFQVPFHMVAGISLGRYPEQVEIKESGLIYRCAFVIATDLRKNGRYSVVEPEDSVLLSLKNGDELKELLTTHVKFLMELYTEYKNSFLPPAPYNPKYVIAVNDHVTTEGPQDAFRHMFLLQVDQHTATGKLVLGDLSGVAIQNTRRGHGRE